MEERLIANIFLLVAVVYFPWWAVFLAFMLFTLFLDNFYEAVLFAFVFEVMNGPVLNIPKISNYLVFTFITLFLVYFWNKIKERLIF